MSTQRRRVGRVVGVVVLTVGASLLTPMSADAAPPSLRVSDTRPIRGETVTVRADLPGSGQRTIRLQRRADDRWVTVASKRSNRKVATTFTRRTASAVTYRAVAGSGSDRRTSRRVTVRPASQAARLVLPRRASAGQPLRATAVFAPARRGRPVSFEQYSGGTWRTVARTRQDRAGRALATVRPTTSTRYRVVTASARGAARSTTSSVSVTVTPSTPTPPPAPPELRCELQAGGTVTWGTGDTTHAMAAVARLDVTTADGKPITSKTEYSRTTLTLTEPGADPVDWGARLRLRGNSTSWVSQKYPYKVKLDAPVGLRGMPASRDWVLLANFYDRAMLRNDTGFDLARRLGADWTPRMQPVELWLNGRLAGLYQLGEGIEVEPNRVDLADGAVLLEADSHPDTDPSFVTSRGLQVFVKSSEDDTVAARTADRVRRIEDVLYSSHWRDPAYGYRACLDVDSFVDAYLLAETTKNIDAAFHNSVWMVLGADGRLAMGPAWDFDMGMGNRTNWQIDDPEGWFVNRSWFGEGKTPPSQLRGPEGHWYRRLMTDPWFVERVRERWSQVRGSLTTLPAHVDETAVVLASAAERNFAPVSQGGAGMPLTPTSIEEEGHVFHGSWSAEAAELSQWLADRIAWLDAQLG